MAFIVRECTTGWRADTRVALAYARPMTKPKRPRAPKRKRPPDLGPTELPNQSKVWVRLALDLFEALPLRLASIQIT
jgi:hypothetical protein